MDSQKTKRVIVSLASAIAISPIVGATILCNINNSDADQSKDFLSFQESKGGQIVGETDAGPSGSEDENYYDQVLDGDYSLPNEERVVVDSTSASQGEKGLSQLEIDKIGGMQIERLQITPKKIFLKQDHHVQSYQRILSDAIEKATITISERILSDKTFPVPQVLDIKINIPIPKKDVDALGEKSYPRALVTHFELPSGTSKIAKLSTSISWIDKTVVIATIPNKEFTFQYTHSPAEVEIDNAAQDRREATKLSAVQDLYIIIDAQWDSNANPPKNAKELIRRLDGASQGHFDGITATIISPLLNEEIPTDQNWIRAWRIHVQSVDNERTIIIAHNAK